MERKTQLELYPVTLYELLSNSSLLRETQISDNPMPKLVSNNTIHGMEFKVILKRKKVMCP